MGWSKFTWRAAVAAFVAVVCLLVFAIAALLSEPGRRWTLARITGFIASQGIGFRAKQIYYRPFSLGVVVDQPEFRALSGSAAGAAPFLTADRLEVELGWRTAAITVESPKLAVTIDQAGHMNLPVLPKGESSGSAPVTVERVRLNNGSFTVRDESRGLGASLGKWQALATRLPGGDYRVEFHTDQPGQLMYQGRTESIDSLRLSYSGTAIERLELLSSLGRVEARGPVNNLNVRAEADLAKLDSRARGKASADVRVAGAVSGELSVVSAAWQQYGPVDATVRFAANEALDRVTVSELRGNWEGAEFSGAGEVEKTGRSTASLRFSGLDARRFEKRAATIVAGNVSVSWPGLDGFAQATGAGALQFTPARAVAGATPVKGRLNIAAGPTLVRLTTDGIGSGPAIARGEVTVDRRSQALSGTLNVEAVDLEPAKGIISVDAALSGTISQPAADFTLSAPALQLTQGPSIQLSARGNATPSVVRVDSLEARTGDARITASGQADIRDGDTALQFDGTLDRTSIAAFTSVAQGSVSGAFTIRGTARQPEASANLTAAALRAYGVVLGNGRMDVRYGPAGISVPRLELVKGDGRITASVSGQYRAAAEIRNFAIDTKDASGVVNGKLSFDGASLEQGTGAANLTITNLVASGRTPGTVELTTSLAQGLVKANAALPSWGVTSSATAAVHAPYAATVEAALRDFALENVSDITGKVTGTLRANGELANPDTLQGAAEIASLRVQSGRESAANSGPIRVRYANGVADIESATIVSGDSRITAHGQVPVRQKGEAAVTFEGDIDMALAARLAQLDPALDPAGRVRVQGTLTGSSPNWQPNATAELIDGRITVPGVTAPVTAIHASLSIREGIVKIAEATAAWLGGTLRLSGEAPINASEYRLQAEAKGIHIEQIPNAAQLAGVINLRAEAQGRGLDIRGLNAKIEAPGLRLQMGQLELAARATPTVTVQDGLVRISDFELAGTGTQFQIRGQTALTAPYPLAIRVEGDLDAALATLFTDELAAQGRTKLQVSVTGTASNPRFGGSVQLADVQATIPAANAVLENLNALVELTGQQVTISNATGTLNGGALTAKGTAELRNGALVNVAVDFQNRNSAWNIPDGLQTAANIDLHLAGSGPQLTLSGDIRILDGSYRERLIIERGLLNSLQQTAAAGAAGQQRFPLNLDVRVRTINPILVSNDLLNGAITGDVRFRGTLQRPGITGRMDLEEGGILYLGGRNYLAERASVTFINERRIEPLLDVQAQTKAGGRQITLQARGPLGNKLETTFTSDDGLPEPDILALLVTGRTLSETRGAESEIATDQAISYLAGSVGGTLSSSANRALGFNFVRIDPSLIAQEAEPTARLTLGQDITDKAGLVYSVNLKNSSDQIWIGRYDVTRRFSARVVRQSDNSYRLQFQHDLEFGGDKPPDRRRRGSRDLKVGQVTIAGNPPVPEAELRKRFGLRTGKNYDFFQFRKGIDRIKETLTKRGYPEAVVRSERKTPTPGTVDLALTVEAGQPVQFVYEGSDVPGKVKRKVELAWSQNSFDALRSRQAVAALQEHFAGDGYYEASIGPAVQDNPRGGKRVLFEIARGARRGKLEFAFPGASDRNAKALKHLFPDKKARLEAVLKPDLAHDKVAEYYRSQGYLAADVKRRVLEKPNAGTLRYSLPVNEGAQYKIGNVEVAGAPDVGKPVSSGDAFIPAEADRAALRIEETLEQQGFTKVETAVEVARHDDAKTVDLTYQVTPGDKQVLEAVGIEGNRYTSENLIRTQLGLKPGEPISSQKLTQARRNLYDTGAFISTDLDLQPGDRGPGGVSTRLLARVREVRPYELRYGGLFDTDRGPGGIVDFAARNVLGGARVAGFRGRYDGELREGRAYFEQPTLLRFPMKWVTTGFVRRELTPGFLTDRTGGSTTVEFRWKRSYRLNAGYRFEQVHTFERVPDPLFPFDVRLRIAPLTAGFQRDTRNDILDPKTGSYFSHIAEWAPSTLGSQLRYAKYFGQYFLYRPLLGERRFSNAPSRPGMVLAAGARFGIAGGLGGQELIPSERFFSGGGTSVRGFAQDTLGALPGELPIGGEGIWIANVEARIPLFKYADIVGFLDAGNVYEHWRDLSFAGARFSGGLGIRIRTPYVLLRIDYGIKLNRKPGESFGRLFGGIGQAF